MNLHQKHLEIGKILLKQYPDNVVLDYACTNEMPKQQIPLFFSSKKTADSRLCNVDAVLLNDGLLKVIIEVEETGIIPTKICGKFLTSAFAEYLIHDSVCAEPIKIEDCLFLQILNDQNLELSTKKKLQGEMIERKINKMTSKGHIKEYRLFWYSDVIGNSKLFLDKISEFI